ncbi:hypothetical protein TD95_002996 [Thielaviopsis punctulata]|uniref:alpha-1,2-Mannosidase n=1 Tax=Thielaviopsis punctulata TaxID=72032 RepID=A0A0F4ZHH4_9PEZI|nr:hypothetical protein TD95_002996 [Thielaviopsis punctulata]
MLRLRLRPVLLGVFALSLFLYGFYFYHDASTAYRDARTYLFVPSSYDWAAHPLAFPIPPAEMAVPPSGRPRRLPAVQHAWTKAQAMQHARASADMRAAVVNAFRKTYASYERLAFGHDELAPLSGQPKDPFSGWGATIVDSLDTIWLMNLRDEWERAVNFVAGIDWNKSTTSSCNLFETGIRYLGGLLSAYELSGERVLLRKAVELGDMMYAAFDNELHLPRGRFTWTDLKAGKVTPLEKQSMAGIGSFTLEFTKLSLLTKNNKYYDVVDRITRHFARTQNDTLVPGLWPVHINAAANFSVADGTAFHFGASADSAYEYFPKMHALLAGQEPLYESLYKTSTDAGIKHLVYRPMLPEEDNVLFMGALSVSHTDDGKKLVYGFAPTMNHLTCFVGGMMLLGGKLINDVEHVRVGEKLALGCASAYNLVSPSHIMPESATFIKCPSLDSCPWDEALWADSVKGTTPPPRGFRSVVDPKYILRPEAIESIFVLWRTTGDQRLLHMAEGMWTAISRACEGETAFASLRDVTQSTVERVDSMESFFLAETLKYFFLIYSNPNVISLDEWVLNTEAHPLRREKPRGS